MRRTALLVIAMVILSTFVIAQGSPFDPNQPSTWTPENIALNAEAAFAKDSAKALEILGDAGISGATGGLREQISKAFAKNPALIVSRKPAAADFFKKGGALTGADDSKAFTNFMTVMGLPLNKAPAGMKFDGVVSAAGTLSGTLIFGTTTLPLDGLGAGTRLITTGEGAKGKILICAPDAKECNGVDVDGAVPVGKDGKRPTLRSDGHTLRVVENGKTVVEVDSNVITSIKELPTAQGAPGAERRFAFTDRQGIKFTVDTGPLTGDRTPVNPISIVHAARPGILSTAVIRPGQDLSITGKDGRVHTVSSVGDIKGDTYKESVFVYLGTNGFFADGTKMAYNAPVLAGKEQRALTYESKDRNGKPIEGHLEVTTTGASGVPSREMLTDYDNSLIIDGKGVSYAYGSGRVTVRSGNAVALAYDGAPGFGYSINPLKQAATYDALIAPDSSEVRAHKGNLPGPLIAQRMPDGSTKTFQMEARAVSYQRYVPGESISHDDGSYVKEYRVEMVPTEVRTATKASIAVNKAPIIIDDDTGPTVYELPPKKVTKSVDIVDTAQTRAEREELEGTALPIPKDVAAALKLPPGATSTEPVKAPAVVTTTQEDAEAFYWDGGKEDIDGIERIDHEYGLGPLVPGTPEPQGIFSLLTPQVSLAVTQSIAMQTILATAAIQSAMQAALPLQTPVPPVTLEPSTAEIPSDEHDYSMGDYFDEKAQNQNEWQYPTEGTGTPEKPAEAVPPYAYTKPTSSQIAATSNALRASGEVSSPVTMELTVFNAFGLPEKRSYIVDGNKETPFMKGETMQAVDAATGDRLTLSVAPCGPQGCGLLEFNVASIAGKDVQPVTPSKPNIFAETPYKDVIKFKAPSAPVEQLPTKTGLTSFSKYNVNGVTKEYYYESGAQYYGNSFTVYESNGDGTFSPVTLQMTGGGCTSGGCKPAAYTIVSDGATSTGIRQVEYNPISSTDDSTVFKPLPTTGNVDSYATDRLVKFGHSGGTFVEKKKYCCGAGDAVLYQNVRLSDGRVVDIMYQIGSNGRLTGHSSVKGK